MPEPSVTGSQNAGIIWGGADAKRNRYPTIPARATRLLVTEYPVGLQISPDPRVERHTSVVAMAAQSRTTE